MGDESEDFEVGLTLITQTVVSDKTDLKMSKPVVFFDFDDTKIDTIPAMMVCINRHFGIGCTRDDFVGNPSLELVLNKYLPKERHLTRDQAYQWLTADFLCSAPIHEGIPLIEDVLEILPRIARKYEIWTVTAREKVCAHIVRNVLDRYLPGCVAGIHCVWEREDGIYRGVSKREFISNFNAQKEAFFDDSPGEVLSVGDVIPSYLFDPYGHHDYIADIDLRVRSWREIATVLL